MKFFAILLVVLAFFSMAVNADDTVAAVKPAIRRGPHHFVGGRGGDHKIGRKFGKGHGGRRAKEGEVIEKTA